MTYALAWPLQEALFTLLSTDPACAAAFEGRIYDAAGPDTGPAIPDGAYVTFGDEEASNWGAGDHAGAVHLVSITVHAPQRGFAQAKQGAAAISDAVLGGGLQPGRGRVVNAGFVDAKTKRLESDALRQITLRFRIVVEA